MNPATDSEEVAADRLEAGRSTPVREQVVAEAALHIRVNGVACTTTMRSPGADGALTRGLLYTEGIITSLDARLGLQEIPDPETGHTACIDVTVPEHLLEKDVAERRAQISTASCGMCGLREPREIELDGPPLPLDDAAPLTPERILSCMERMRAGQRAFDLSGGAHAAAAFDARDDVLALFEDVGRHNAVDKVIGALLGAGKLHEARLLTISGRVSYEIVFKAYRARIPVLAAVSAPSSLAVQSAQRFGLTLAAFCRDERLTLYAAAGRVVLSAPALK